MLNYVKKIIPDSFKKSFKKFIVSQVGESKLNNIDILINIIYDLSPPFIIVNEKTKKTIEKFKRQYGIPDELNINISKNDMMYFYTLYFCKGNIQKTYIDYLESGLNSFNVIRKIADFHFGKLQNAESILDYAAGYGRLTRFLILYYPKNKLWVSDIKDISNKFQHEQFGVNTLEANFEPNEFDPKRTFDIIFVGSLFTHLPEELFIKWLIRLYNLINENGILILSTHDISMISKNRKTDFSYSEDSEEYKLQGFIDAIEDNSVYGTTFLSENKFKTFLKNSGISEKYYHRYANALYYGQDIYILTKANSKFNDSIQFNVFP